MKATLILLTIFLLGTGSSFTYAQIITTIAGTNLVQGYSGDGGPSTAAKVFRPHAVATDAAGNVYIADEGNHVIRKINTNGIITTVAGNGTAGYSGDGGPATSAQLTDPTGLAVDKAGNLYIAENYAAVVRKVNTSGIISIYAGAGLYRQGYSGDGGPATKAQLDIPISLAIDDAGNLYISDAGNYTVRKVSPSGIITTFAGNGKVGYTGDGGPAVAASLDEPFALAADNAGNVYITENAASTVRKVNAAGIITTIAGKNTLYGYSGDGGPAVNAQLGFPSGVATDTSGNVYITDDGIPTIRKIDASGIITRFALTGLRTYGGDGGPALAAQMWEPMGIATDNVGHFYVTDYYNSTVRKITECLHVAITLQPSNTNPCENSNASFQVNSPNADTYQWQVNDGSGWTNITDGVVYGGATTNSLVISRAALSMNNYQYRCALSNACSSDYSAVALLTITPFLIPNVAIAPSPNNICSGASTTFTATVTNSNPNPSYSWQVYNGNAWSDITDGSVYSGSSTNTLVITNAPASINNYQYRCKASDHCNNNYSSPALLTVVEPPAVYVNTSVSPICSGNPATFLATTTNGTAQWQVNDGSGWTNITDNSTYSGALTNAITISKVNASMNNYQYRCTATNTCSTVYSSALLLTVTAVPAPTITIAASANDVCSGTPVTFTATTTNGGTKPDYQWQVNGTNAGTNSADYTSGNLNDGDIVTCLFMSSLACASPVASTNNIVMNIKPSPAVSVTADTTIKQGNSVPLNATATGTVNTYQWLPATDLSDPNIANPTTRPVNTITYQVTATAGNGCTGYGKVTITVLKKIVLPNAFTPNGDGKNDVFRIPPGITFSLKTFSIFDRWGNMVFQTNDINQGWNGTFNGQPANAGTYVYMITGSSQNEQVALKGTLELLR